MFFRSHVSLCAIRRWRQVNSVLGKKNDGIYAQLVDDDVRKDVFSIFYSLKSEIIPVLIIKKNMHNNTILFGQ
ncbi:MAG: hypothetical protein D3910_02025 [Candidatus Electrothrix sp. ATG2]|nr:hypothetical protein [Candidatus Electrothrix sp. ATG2]